VIERELRAAPAQSLGRSRQGTDSVASERNARRVPEPAGVVNGRRAAMRSDGLSSGPASAKTDAKCGLSMPFERRSNSRCLELWEQRGDAWFTAQTLSALGDMACTQADYSRAGENVVTCRCATSRRCQNCAAPSPLAIRMTARVEQGRLCSMVVQKSHAP
jgi:hypothetical protein